jgi:hypothetical protein
VRKFAFSCGALGAEFASSASEVNPPDLLELARKMKLRPWATVIWFSLSHGGFLSSFFGGTGIRYDRFFTPVTMCGAEAPRK